MFNNDFVINARNFLPGKKLETIKQKQERETKEKQERETRETK